MECDGDSIEQVMQAIDLNIRTYGWHHVLVDAPKPWSYTIGLRESFGHPELAVVDLERSAQVELVRWACESIEDCGSIDAFERSALGVEIVTVHDCHLREGEWFGTWHASTTRSHPRAPSSRSFRHPHGSAMTIEVGAVASTGPTVGLPEIVRKVVPTPDGDGGCDDAR